MNTTDVATRESLGRPVVRPVVVGVLLVLGLQTRFALSLASLLMICLIAGMSLLREWETVGLQMLYLLVYFALLLFASANRYSLDGYFPGPRRG